MLAPTVDVAAAVQRLVARLRARQDDPAAAPLSDKDRLALRLNEQYPEVRAGIKLKDGMHDTSLGALLRMQLSPFSQCWASADGHAQSTFVLRP